MSTVVLNAYSIAYPSITNRIRASVYLQSSPTAFIAMIIDSTSGHPARTWSFPGLQRNNYGFIMEEIDGSDNPVNTLAQFDVVPGQINGELSRDDEQIQVDSTPGLVAGTTQFIFDGAETFSGSGIYKPNYLGWNIVPSELTGRGILVRDLDYSWDALTGTFNLLQAGDTFQTNTYFNIHFDPNSIDAGNSVPAQPDVSIRLITTDTTLLYSDFGQRVLVEPASPYIEITLPDITTIPQGRMLPIDIGNVPDCCAEFVGYGSDNIDFLSGKVLACPNESLIFYVFTRGGVNEWRVSSAVGNFREVGKIISSDMISVDNAVKLDGSSISSTQYARLYNMVLNLPVGRVVNYDDWDTSVNNMCRYSLANSSNPINAGKFHVPDRTDLFERAVNYSSSAGDYSGDTVIDHYHKESIGQLPTPPFGQDPIAIVNMGKYSGGGTVKPDYVSTPIDITGTHIGSTETKPKNYRINKFVLV